MQRIGSVINIKSEKIEEYKRYHKSVWPWVLRKIRECNIRNYSIFLKDNNLFSYFEYMGEDYKADMKKMADDAYTQKWWNIIMPMQEPLSTRKSDEWWAEMEEVFHSN